MQKTADLAQAAGLSLKGKKMLKYNHLTPSFVHVRILLDANTAPCNHWVYSARITLLPVQLSELLLGMCWKGERSFIWVGFWKEIMKHLPTGSTNQRRRWRCKMLLTRHGQRQGSKALGLMTKTIWIKIERGFWLLDSGLPFSPSLFFSFVNEMSSVS